MSILEALYIVSQNANGVKMNYFDEYLPAILMVNERWPHEGRTVEDEGEIESEIVAGREEQNAAYDRRHQN
jgi:hypothetical protein